MQYKSAKEIWDKIVLSYEGDEQVKRAKLQTLRIQYENLRMYNDESVANYFLRVDEIVNCMKNLGEEIKEAIVVEKFLRSLSPKFESKVSAIEEKENLRILTMSQLHEILTAYEMRKGGPSDRREAAFKASGKGDYYEASHVPEEEEEESNFVRNLQRGSGRFRVKLPFKCFACGRVGHYAAKCPYKDKGKEPARWNKKQGANKKSYYTHEDSDGLSNSDEDERGNEYKLLMAFEDDDYMDSIDMDNLFEEITRLKRCIEEKNMIIDTLQFQIDEKEKHFEKLEGEIVALRKEIEKKKLLILSLSKDLKLWMRLSIYLDAAKRSEQKHNGDYQVKQGQIANKGYQGQFVLRVNKRYNQPQVKSSQFGSRMNNNRDYNHLAGRFDNRRSFNGQCFSCHNFGHKAAQCVAYKTIITREAQKQRSMNGITKRTYKNFSALENEVECSICNKFGHEDSECRSRFQQKKEQASSTKTWRIKEPQTERCGIAFNAEGQENLWYIDSGCSKHMTGEKEKLESYSALEKGKKVSFGNDTPATIKGKGIARLKEKVKAGNVLYVDGLKHNLLSVSQMCDQRTEVIFRSNGCLVRDLDTSKTMIKGKRTPNNLYIFEE
eukprot:PITA_11740